MNGFSFWDNPDLLIRVGRWVPYVFIILGFLVAGSGQFVKGLVDGRIAQLRQQSEDTRKRTPPSIDAQLAVSDKGNLYVVIEAKNQIPLKSRWLVVTEENQVVSGLMIQDAEFHPSQEKKRWQDKLHIDKEKIRNDYLELRMDYRSVYAAELDHPERVTGKIVHKYKLIDGAPHPLPNSQTEAQAASSE